VEPLLVQTELMVTVVHMVAVMVAVEQGEEVVAMAA